MLQFFYTKNEEKKKFTSLLFYIRPEQKATVDVFEAKRLESEKKIAICSEKNMKKKK
jgi:hypothetical protein